MSKEKIDEMSDDRLREAWAYVNRSDRQEYLATEQDKKDLKEEMNKRGM